MMPPRAWLRFYWIPQDLWTILKNQVLSLEALSKLKISWEASQGFFEDQLELGSPEWYEDLMEAFKITGLLWCLQGLGWLLVEFLKISEWFGLPGLYWGLSGT